MVPERVGEQNLTRTTLKNQKYANILYNINFLLYLSKFYPERTCKDIEQSYIILLVMSNVR